MLPGRTFPHYEVASCGMGLCKQGLERKFSTELFTVGESRISYFVGKIVIVTGLAT